MAIIIPRNNSMAIPQPQRFVVTTSFCSTFLFFVNFDKVIYLNLEKLARRVKALGLIPWASSQNEVEIDFLLVS